jgi:hypothetical protein
MAYVFSHVEADNLQTPLQWLHIHLALLTRMEGLTMRASKRFVLRIGPTTAYGLEAIFNAS